MTLKGKEYCNRFSWQKKWSGHGRTADYGPASESAIRSTAAAVLTASQCFNSRSRIPKVAFGCASPSHMIKILRAFHGVRAASGSSGGDNDVMRSRRCDDVTGDALCSHCPGDCVDDSINEVSASIRYDTMFSGGSTLE